MHVDAIVFAQNNIGPAHPRVPVLDPVDQPLADRPGLWVIFADKDLDLVTRGLGADSEVEEPVTVVADQENAHVTASGKAPARHGGG
jgi:hypothetical protein